MVTKKQRRQRNIVGGIALIVVLVAVAIFSQQFAIFADDFVIEEDFSTPSPALLKDDSYTFSCGSGCTTTKYEDQVWSITVENQQGRNADFSIDDNRLRLLARGSFNSGDRSGISATFKKDLKNRDVIISGSTTNVGNLRIFLGNGMYTRDFTPGDFLFEAIQDIEEQNLYHIFWNGVEVSTFMVTSDTAMLKFEFSGDRLQNSAQLYIDEIKSRPYFNCEVEADEVVIRDRFVEGSTFSFEDLSFTPIKFCVDSYPAIKRSLTEEGVRADIQGQLTRSLTRGQSITVSEGETIEIYYIADFTEGMGERCSLDSAYDPEVGQCVKIIEEAEDIIEIIEQIEFIEVGREQVLVDNEVLIAGTLLSASKPSYGCVSEDDNTVAPNPREDCWTTTLSYGTQSFVVQANEEIDLNEYIRVKWIPQATIDNGVIEEGYINKLLITVKNNDIITLEVIPDEDLFVLFGEEKSVDFKLTNNLGFFEESGFKVTRTTDLLFGQDIETIEQDFEGGEDTYSVPIDTNEFGGVTYEIQPFYRIGDKIFFDNEKVVRSYEIVDVNPIEELQMAIDDKIGEIEVLESELEGLNSLLAQREQTRTDLQTQINAMDVQLNTLEQQLVQQEGLVTELEGQIQVKQETIDELQQLVELANTQIQDIQSILVTKQQRVDELLAENLVQEQKIAELLENLEEKVSLLAELGDLTDEQEAELQRIRGLFTESQDKIAELELVIQEDRQIIGDLETSVDNQETSANDLLTQNSLLEQEVLGLEGTITLEQQKAAELRQQIEQSQLIIDELRVTNTELENTLESIREISEQEEQLVDDLVAVNDEINEALAIEEEPLIDFNLTTVLIIVAIIGGVIFLVTRKPRKGRRRK